MKYLFKLFIILLAFTWCVTSLAQQKGDNSMSEVSPILGPVNQDLQLAAIWDVEFNYDATVITLAAGNAGAVYIPTLNKFWTSRWATGVAHQWNANGTLDVQFTLPFTGTRGMCFDGQFVYHSINTTAVQIVDPVTRLLVGTIPVVAAPNGARFITYNPDGNSGAGSIIVGNWIAPNLNFYEFSMTGTLLRTIASTVTGVYGLAYDNWSVGGPFLWVWSQGAGAGTPQLIQQMDYTAGTYTGVTHDVKTDVGIGQPTQGIAGGLFITDQLIPGEVTLGGMLQGVPDLLFGYELAIAGPPCPVGAPTNPNPPAGASNLPITGNTLSWTNGAGTTQNEVYFNGNLVYDGAAVTSRTLAQLGVEPLQYNTPYTWRIVCKDAACGLSGPTWTFTTMDDPLLGIDTKYCDDFTAGSGNWTITNDGGVCVWLIIDITTRPYTMPATASGNALSADVDLCGSGTTLLSTATLNNVIDFTTQNYNYAEIQFDNDWRFLAAADEAHVEVSTNGGSTWTAVWSRVGVNERNTHETVDISSLVLNQSNVRFRLRSVQPGWDWWWVVDNFCIYAHYTVPVELTSFAAVVAGGNVELNWSTATETNNQGFQVERSNGGEFNSVGFVAGYGTTTETQNYIFTDRDVPVGNYSYRLKQVDFDGTFEYSDVVEAEVAAPVEFSLDQNYPNPFNPSTKITFRLAADSKVSLKVFDVLGQEVMTLINNDLSAGSHQVDFDASSLNSGVYFYKIEATANNGTNFNDVKKMVLTK